MVTPYHFDPKSKSRQRASLALLLVMLVTLVSVSFAQQTGDVGPAEGRQLTLRQQLTTGLRAFTPADFAFIDRVVLAVQQGRLPRRMVDSTFLWARDRAARRSYVRRLRPMVFFRPGLILRARQINVAL